MRLDVDISSIAEALRAEIEAGERAVTLAMRRASEGLKADWRAEITRGGLGRRLAGAVRSETYPRQGVSMSAASLVWSNAPEIMESQSAGATIRARGGRWLAIPTPAAGRDVRGKRFTPATWERRTGLTLRMVSRPGRASFLVADARIDARGRARASRSRTGRGVATVPIFVIVRQVSLRPRIDLAGPTRTWESRLPRLIVDAWLEGAP